jgi:phospholipid-translocating ATPase
MFDGFYQSVMCFFIPYLLFLPATPLTGDGIDVAERLRFGAYILHPIVVTINLYIMLNSYRWDWLMLLIVFISDLSVFFWTGIYTSFTGAGFFYKAAMQIYGEASFWACFFLVPLCCLFPRFAIKAMQKVYFPYDVDIIREQEIMGRFAYLDSDSGKAEQPNTGNDFTSQESALSEDLRNPKRATYQSVDEDLRPIYPPSTTTHATTRHQHSQNGSDSTQFTVNRSSYEHPVQLRPSFDRARPSYDRIRASMDRMRPSFEASNDMTSAARLSRIESTQSQTITSRLKPRLRGLSLSKSANN